MRPTGASNLFSSFSFSFAHVGRLSFAAGFAEPAADGTATKAAAVAAAKNGTGTEACAGAKVHVEAVVDAILFKALASGCCSATFKQNTALSLPSTLPSSCCCARMCSANGRRELSSSIQNNTSIYGIQ